MKNKLLQLFQKIDLTHPLFKICQFAKKNITNETIITLNEESSNPQTLYRSWKIRLHSLKNRHINFGGLVETLRILKKYNEFIRMGNMETEKYFFYWYTDLQSTNLIGIFYHEKIKDEQGVE